MEALVNYIKNNHIVKKKDGHHVVTCVPASTRRKQPAGPRKRALLVGCNYVHSQNELNGCVNDSVNVAEMLHRKEPSFEIHMLADAGFNGAHPDVEHGVLPPTKANILNGLNWLVQDAHPGDWLLFHYSGHGIATALPPNTPIDIRKTEQTNQQHQVDAIIPSDFNKAGGSRQQGFIYNFVIRQYIDKLPQGVNVVIIVDACYSASIADLRYSYPNIDSPNPKVACTPQISNPSLTDTKANVYCFSGCLLSQTSADAFLEPIRPRQLLAQGALSHDLLQLVYDSLDKHPLPSYHEFMQQLHAQMRADNFDQISMLSTGLPIDVSHKCILFEMIGCI